MRRRWKSFFEGGTEQLMVVVLFIFFGGSRVGDDVVSLGLGVTVVWERSSMAGSLRDEVWAASAGGLRIGESGVGTRGRFPLSWVTIVKSSSTSVSSTPFSVNGWIVCGEVGGGERLSIWLLSGTVPVRICLVRSVRGRLAFGGISRKGGDSRGAGRTSLSCSIDTG